MALCSQSIWFFGCSDTNQFLVFENESFFLRMRESPLEVQEETHCSKRRKCAREWIQLSEQAAVAVGCQQTGSWGFLACTVPNVTERVNWKSENCPQHLIVSHQGSSKIYSLSSEFMSGPGLGSNPLFPVWPEGWPCDIKKSHWPHVYSAAEELSIGIITTQAFSDQFLSTSWTQETENHTPSDSSF